MSVADLVSKRPESSTADDTLKRKTRDADVISGGHLVAKALKNEGVDTIFTLCGGHTIHLYDGGVDEGIHILAVRHEQMAAPYPHPAARPTGKPRFGRSPPGSGVNHAPPTWR